MADNPYASYFKQDSSTGSPVSVNTPTPSVPSTDAGNPYANFFKPSQTSTQLSSPAPMQSGANPYASYLSSAGQGPTPTHDESDRFTQEDPDANFLEKSWSFLNKPLTETLFGWGQYRPGAGGLERGVEKIAAGLTSPLSLLTFAAFAPAGIAEGVAGGLLKDGLTEGAEMLGGEAIDGAQAALKVENYAKAVDAAKRAQIAGKPISEAVSAATNGTMPYQEFLNYGQYLRANGLTEADVLPESFFRRGVSRIASSGLSKAGITPGKAVAIAKGVEAGVNAGFGIQQLHGALYAYPRVMDLMSQGDYDDALEYLVEGGAGTVFGTLGLAHGVHSVHDIVPALNERDQLAISDETEAMKKLAGFHDGQLGKAQFDIAANQRKLQAQLLDSVGIPVPADLKAGTWSEVGPGQEISTFWNKIIQNKENRTKLADSQAAMFHLLDTGGDRTLLHQEAQALIYGYKLEDWAKDNIPTYKPYERDLDSIQNEEQRNLLYAKNLASENKAKVQDLDTAIQSLSQQLKDANPVDSKGISDTLEKYRQQRNELQLQQDGLDREFEKAKAWQNPDKDVWRQHYDDLYAKLLDAWKPIAQKLWKSDPAGALDEFNQKVRALGWNPHDIDLIEKKFPEFRFPEAQAEFRAALTELPKNYEVREESNQNNPTLKTWRVYNERGGMVGFGYSPQDATENALKFLNEPLPEINPEYERNGPFYYKSAQVIADKIKGPAQGPQILKTLQNSGVKPEELYWTGLEDLLKENRKFTPQELQDHINSHKIDIEEVTHGTLGPEEDFVRNNATVLKAVPPESLPKYVDNVAKANGWDSGKLGKLVADLVFNKEYPQGEQPIRYGKYTLPGGENKRELLLTVPNLGRSGALQVANEFRKYLYDRYGSKWWEEAPAEEQEKLHNLNADAIAENRKATRYSSGHWEEPNVLAHVRFDDRVTPDGKRLLHLDELQSDWHQEGREKGYQDLEKKKQHADLYNKFDEASRAREDAYGDLADTTTLAQREQVFQHNFTGSTEGLSQTAIEAFERFKKAYKEQEQARQRLTDLNYKPNAVIPNAPFKKTWPDLLIKRMVHYAAENGYDGISWTPGAEQNARYSLSNIADEVRYDPENKELHVVKNGRIISTHPEVTPEKLPSYIGKEVASRLLDSPIQKLRGEQNEHGYYESPSDVHVLKGPNLEVGGQGMRGFYDKIVPDAMNAIGKKFGTKVDTTKIPTGASIKVGENNLVSERTPKYDSVQYLPLNSQLKNSVLDEGFPLFNRVYPPELTDAEKSQISAGIEKVTSQIKTLANKLADSDDEAEIAQINKKLAKLSVTIDRLQSSYERGVPTNYIGEVHKLADGTKVLYATRDTLAKLQNAMGLRRVPLGEHISGPTIDYALQQIESRKSPDLELHKLLTNARNENGQIVLSRTPESHAGPLSARLNTLREELNHNWQGSLAKSVTSRHLRAEDYQTLSPQLPKGVRAYLNAARYKTSPTVRVIEGAAKLMSVKDLADLHTNPEEARDFLMKYFQAVKDLHGDKAFDTLNHTTNFARKLKEEFLYGRKTEPTEQPIGGETPGVVGGVREGAGSPPTGPPAAPGGTGEPPEPFDWRQGTGYTSAFPRTPWLDGPLHGSLPVSILDRVEKSRGKTFSPEQTEYVKKQVSLLSNLASRELNPKEAALYKSLRKADDDNWTTGYNHGIIGSIVDNHIHHIWGKEDPVGKTLLQQAGSGAFSINASQARHRTWGTALEGILQGRRLQTHDPVNIISHDANNIAEAAAHRNFLKDLVSSGLKDPEGMPIAAYFGRGYVVPGEDGSPSAILVNPNVVRNIKMSDTDVNRLDTAGLLKTYLKDGRVVDRTAYANQENVKAWIENTQKKITKLEQQNPLLIDPRERTRHEAAWGQLQEFAKSQAQKIADHIDAAVKAITDKGTVDGKNYAPLTTADRPNDVNMVGYLGRVLYGEVGRKVSPADLQRIEKYADRNRLYAEGKSSYGNSPLRPSEVAQLLLQEKSHLDKDPELSQYINDVHGIVGSDWSRKGIGSAVAHIAHAADNPQHKQLIRDLADLKYVDNVLNTDRNTLIRPWKEAEMPPFKNLATVKEQQAEAEARLKEINDRQPKQYLWAPKSHITPNHYAFTGYKWMATAGDGTPTLAESDIGISRYYYKYLTNRLGLEPSWLRKEEGLGKITAPLLKAGASAKSAILSGSPFHVIQEMLRASMLWMNPFARPNPVENLNEGFQSVRGVKPLLRLGVENGLTLFNNRFQAEDYSVGLAGHGGIIAHIPVYGKYADAIHDFLFNRLIPSYKASGFRKMFDKYASAHPDWTDDAVSREAARHVNNAFGGQNWREMGRAASTQDWFHLVALAPDWLESEMRFAAGLLRGTGIGPAKYEPDYGRNFTREQVAGTAAALWAVARVLNLLYSGNAHYETPFGLATKDKDGREVEFSVRTMPTDILHMASDPMGFLTGRESPFVRTTQEAVTGRNQYGQKLTEGQKYVDLVSNLVPIWGQAGLKQITNLATSADVGTAEQVAKASGLTAQVYRTPAEKLAAQLASERSEEGQMNPSKIARHRTLLQLEDSMREGKINRQDLAQMVDYGNLPIADAKNVVKNVKETAGMDPEKARLYSRVSRLDFQGAISVYDSASPQEKQALQKLIMKKARSYVKKARTDYTPSEREKDPLFKRARQIAPAIEPEAVSQ